MSQHDTMSHHDKQQSGQPGEGNRDPRQQDQSGRQSQPGGSRKEPSTKGDHNQGGLNNEQSRHTDKGEGL